VNYTNLSYQADGLKSDRLAAIKFMRKMDEDTLHPFMEVKKLVKA
jgi:hypothetical protein